MAKKNKRRRNRDRQRRQRNLTALFYDLYPNAPPETATEIVEYALTANLFDGQSYPTNTAVLEYAALVYVRDHFTDYSQTIDGFMDSILHSIEAGQAYQGKTPEALEREANLNAEEIINRWR